LTAAFQVNDKFLYPNPKMSLA